MKIRSTRVTSEPLTILSVKEKKEVGPLKVCKLELDMKKIDSNKQNESFCLLPSIDKYNINQLKG